MRSPYRLHNLPMVPSVRTILGDFCTYASQQKAVVLKQRKGLSLTLVCAYSVAMERKFNEMALSMLLYPVEQPQVCYNTITMIS